VDSQVQLLASRSLARETIGQLQLATDPELTGEADGGAGLLTRVLARTPLAPGEPAVPLPVDMVGRFLERLAVKREGKSHVIGVAYRSSDPVKAAAVANLLAELYIVGQLARKYEASRQQSGWLDAQSRSLKGQLEAAEAKLAAFRAESEAARGETLGADPGEIAGLNGQLVAATVDRTGKEATLGRLRRLAESDERGAAPMAELGSSAMLDNLMALKAELLRREAELAGQYGERHPKLLDARAEKAKLEYRIREERQALLRQFEAEVARARAAERTLAGKLDDLKGKALRHEGAAQRAQELEREVELNRRLYESYLARASVETRPQGAQEPDARIISEAVPPATPSFPKPRLVLSLALTGGFLLGLVAMYVAESGESGFRPARDVAEVLALPTLALVPKPDLGRRDGAGALTPQDYVVERPRSRYAEAMREVLTGVLLRRAPEAGGGPALARVVLVTSALPGEGKSTLTVSLARVAAAEGMRVMVVDGDLRKPALHELVGLKPGAGLVEVLRREVPLAEAVAVDPRLPLRLLPGSRRLMQPTRLLGRDGFGALLAAVRPSFDLILVDSAPLVAVADAKLMAKFADVVLFVVRHGATRRDFCRVALQGLRESGATIAGAVLTQVDLRRHARSGGADAGFAHARLNQYYAD
jgi:polysaccharide biosynthesis transport protein